MVEFLETTGVSADLRKLISKSKQRLFLISPYLQISKNLRINIQQLDQTVPTIDIKVVCRKDKINADDLSFLQSLKNAKISALDNLHAKCYLNEDTAIITSMNLYQYSQENNWEMGIKVEREKEAELYDEIFRYVQSILTASEVLTKIEMRKGEPEKLTDTKTHKKIEPVKKAPAEQAKQSGFCIRCGIQMPVNPEKPLCSKCYSSWARYSDPLYKERYCHICGQEKSTNYEKPVCYDCYKKFYK